MEDVRLAAAPGAGQGAMTTVDVYRRLPTEAQMLHAIEQKVDYLGGRLWHVNRSDECPELTDLPDLIVIVPGLAALVELKSQRRTVTRGQREVAALLATAERFWGGIVRPVPRAGEMSYDAFLEMLEALR